MNPDDRADLLSKLKEGLFPMLPLPCKNYFLHVYNKLLIVIINNNNLISSNFIYLPVLNYFSFTFTGT